MIRDNIHFDTSPYAYNGIPTNVIDPYAYAGVEDPYAMTGITCVDQYTDDEVEDFNSGNRRVQVVDNPDFGTYDSILGLGNKKRKAERKLRKAEHKLAKGKVKAAERKIGKATKLLGKIGAGQQELLSAQGQLSSINATQSTLGTSNPDIPTSVQPLSAQPLSEVAQAQPIPEGGSGSMIDSGSTSDLTGVESAAPNTSSDTPTGALADTKTLPGVTVKAKKPGMTTIILVIVAAIVIIGAIVYFQKGKKGLKV